MLTTRSIKYLCRACFRPSLCVFHPIWPLVPGGGGGFPIDWCKNLLLQLSALTAQSSTTQSPAARCPAHGAQHHHSARALQAQSTAHSAQQGTAHSAQHQSTAHSAQCTEHSTQCTAEYGTRTWHTVQHRAQRAVRRAKADRCPCAKAARPRCFLWGSQCSPPPPAPAPARHSSVGVPRGYVHACPRLTWCTGGRARKRHSLDRLVPLCRRPLQAGATAQGEGHRTQKSALPASPSTSAHRGMDSNNAIPPLCVVHPIWPWGARPGGVSS